MYRKGAEAVTARLEVQERTIAALQRQLAAVPHATATSLLPLAERVNGPVWRPPQQLALIAGEALKAYYSTSPAAGLRLRRAGSRALRGWTITLAPFRGCPKSHTVCRTLFHIDNYTVQTVQSPHHGTPKNANPND
jgi:hypothetical protein